MSRKSKNFLIFTLVVLLGVGATAVLSKGFKNWNVKDNWDDIFNTSTSNSGGDDIDENDNEILEIDFAKAYGLSGTITNQEFTNKLEDGSPGYSYLGFTNEGRFYQNKFIVGKSDATVDDEFKFAKPTSQTLVNADYLYDELPDIEIMGNIAKYANYVFLGFNSEESSSFLKISASYTFDYTTKNNFQIVPFYGSEGSSVFRFFSNYSEHIAEEIESPLVYDSNFISFTEETVQGKVKQTFTVNIEELHNIYQTTDAMDYFEGFGLAIYGVTKDNRITVNSMTIEAKEGMVFESGNKISDHPSFEYNNKEAPETEGVNVLSSSKMNVKKTTSGTDTEGRPFVTMSYTLLPANTTDTSIVAQVDWVDGSIQLDAAEYLKAEIDTTNQTLKVTCLKDFSNQMKVVLKSIVDTTKNATITFDLGQKFLGWKSGIEETYYMFFDDDIPQEDKTNFEPTWWSDYTNGFSSTFTISASKTHTINSISIENSQFYFGAEYTGTHPSLVGYNMASYASSISFPKSLAARDFFDDIQDDLYDLSINEPDITNYLRNEAPQGTMVGVKLALRVTGTYGGVESMFDMNLIIGANVSRLRVPVALASITPEIPSYTF